MVQTQRSLGGTSSRHKHLNDACLHSVIRSSLPARLSLPPATKLNAPAKAFRVNPSLSHRRHLVWAPCNVCIFFIPSAGQGRQIGRQGGQGKALHGQARSRLSRMTRYKYVIAMSHPEFIKLRRGCRVPAQRACATSRLVPLARSPVDRGRLWPTTGLIECLSPPRVKGLPVLHWSPDFGCSLRRHLERLAGPGRREVMVRF